MGLIQPLRDDAPPSEVGPLDAEAAAVQLLWQRVFEGDLCSQLPILLRFTQNLQRTAKPSVSFISTFLIHFSRLLLMTVAKKDVLTGFCILSAVSFLSLYLADHCTHSDFDFRIIQHNVSHFQHLLSGGVVQQQSCQTD